VPTVAVFIDYQNVYRRARGAFFPQASPPHTEGQVSPRKVADCVLAKVNRRASGHTLAFVRVYRGLPDGGKDAKGYAACSKQLAVWQLDPLVQVVARPLRYPPDYPTSPAGEKGIDVNLAVDVITAAHQKAFDVGIIFSADTDQRPTIEAVKSLGSPAIEVAAWKSPTYSGRISLLPKAAGTKPPHLWCHFFDEVDYRAVRDLTNYAK
jgi:NYN domain